MISKQKLKPEYLPAIQNLEQLQVFTDVLADPDRAWFAGHAVINYLIQCEEYNSKLPKPTMQMLRAIISIAGDPGHHLLEDRRTRRGLMQTAVRAVDALIDRSKSNVKLVHHPHALMPFEQNTYSKIQPAWVVGEYVFVKRSMAEAYFEFLQSRTESPITKYAPSGGGILGDIGYPVDIDEGVFS